MKTTKELKSYFDNELADDVGQVERKRKWLIFQLVLVGLFIIAGCAISIMVHLLNPEVIDVGWVILGFMLSFVGGGVMIYEISRNRSFYYKFKNLIIDRIISFIDDSMVYKSHKHIPVNRFVESHLFKFLPTKKYKGDDYVRGKVGDDVALEFSEIVAPYRDKDTNKVNTLFKGLFFIAERQTPFPSATIVVPAGTDLTAAHWSKTMKVERINTGDTNFEKHFWLFSDSTQDTNKIMTQNLRDVLVQFVEKSDNGIRCSFIGHRIYVGITFDKDLFEPKLFKSLKDFSIIEEYYDVLYRALTIIDRIRPPKAERQSVA